ncbi:hypothetical protein CPB85DRAFT_744245 [Mucidula mucida]|nr:hypothetical protein CPB85DRAFT_744245 [Mucidula mucida]
MPSASAHTALVFKHVKFPKKMATILAPAQRLISRAGVSIFPKDGSSSVKAEHQLRRSPDEHHRNPLDADAVADVAGWEKVWDDAGSGKQRDYSLWRGVAANDNYLVIGGIFSTNEGYAPPTEEQTRGIRAIRKDLVVMDTSVWSGMTLDRRRGRMGLCGRRPGLVASPSTR